ncbi:MAG: riboflavin synthase [Phycisphaerales bacterium]|nr:MAG: riboflavin synthase [Phycisphaerales bacterium]
MFTGLIETIGAVKSVRPSRGGIRLTVDLGTIAGGAGTGDSIAVNGTCLTIVRLQGSLAGFDLSAETLAKSALGKLKPSSEVNLERAMKATDRFGGHFVQGHVDGTATTEAIERRGDFAEIRFAAGAELLEGMVVKGSVAVDGISLTIAGIDRHGFSISVIPETLRRTTLGKVKIGDCLNIETDIIVKAVKKQLENILPKTEPLTAEKLRQLGF